MPDWIVHVLVVWIIFTVLSFKYKQFNTPNTVIAMIGSLIPDIFKIGIPLDYLGIHIWNFIGPLHLPVGSIIITSIITLFFRERKLVFLLLIFGVITHYLLDMMLLNLRGPLLLFPFSQARWEFGFIPVDDYYLTIIIIILALIVYGVSYFIKRKSIKVH